MNFNFGKTARIAAILVVAMLLVNWGMQALLGQTVKTMFATVNVPGIGTIDISVPQAYSPISTTVGGKVIGWLSGVIPFAFDITLVFTLFISAFVSLLIGGLLLDNVIPSNWQFKGTVGKLASTIIWGTVPIYLLLVGTVAPSMGTFIGLVIYTFVAAFATSLIAQMAKIQI
jgi:hypothetical protein